ncbi:hypothetical protein E4U57_005212 [Claviceps arundinis]|uniref:WSC domain-containing protein n=1 Tax=Claviceps arundinis TaxID=1623583 RepID=A0ABQ7PI57_9HYPO|nr:hypothetical protein E4U57_005212 [Claviceps arundinis]
MAFSRSVLVAVAMAVLPLAHAWNTELPPCTESFKPFGYSGCFQEGKGGNALIFRSSLEPGNMTIERCTAECKGNGFRYAGLEYYGVCYCGTTIDGVQLDDSKCSLPCSGDNTQKCGGDTTLSIWQDTTFPSSENVSVDAYKSLGCYTDDSSKGRALNYPMDLGGIVCTPKSCLAACKRKNFPYAGIEYGTECYCGVNLATDSAKVDISQCNSQCLDGSITDCGGNSRLSLWVAKDLLALEPCAQQSGASTTLSVTAPTKALYASTATSIDTTTPASSTTTSVESAISTTSIESITSTTSIESTAATAQLPACTESFKPFVYSGCFQDGKSGNALIFRSSLDAGSMTVERCTAECKGNGYRYAGLEYYGVCYCGTTIDGLQLDDSKCSLPCSGDNTQKCGGDSTLSIWQDTTFPDEENVSVDAYKSLGCYTDDSNRGRALNYPMDLGGIVCTPKSCLAACKKKNFPYAGIEYGSECYCGVNLATDSAKVDISQCDSDCLDGSNTKCGGKSRLTLWLAKGLLDQAPCGQQTGTSATLSMTATTEPLYASTLVSIDTTTQASSTSTELIDTTTMSIESTTTTPIESTTTSMESTTSTPIESTTTTPIESTTTTSTEITTTMSTESTTTTAQLPACTESFKPFVYSGCFQDGKSGNALIFRSSLDAGSMTVERCTAECKGNGYRYAGLEYYGVCYCGTTIEGVQLDDSKCSLPCSGDNTQKCGGDSTLSIWQDTTVPDEENVSVDAYKSLGCYTDDSSKGRALNYPMDLGGIVCTPKSCLAACKKKNFPYAGIEYGSECYCGVNITNGSAKVDISQCDSECLDGSNTKCGGKSRLTLWLAKELLDRAPCGQQPVASATLSMTATTEPLYASTLVSIDTTTQASSTSTELIDTTTTSIESTTTSMESTTSTSIDSTTSTSIDSTTTTSIDSTTSTSIDSTTSIPLEFSTAPTFITSRRPTPTFDCDETTTKTASLCTATVTVPPKCEWQAGNWCAPSLPSWQDKFGCIVAKRTCDKQVSSCFRYAGWPGSLECFKFKQWCQYLNYHCETECPGYGCNKSNCWTKAHGGIAKPPAYPPTTTTSAYPCDRTPKPVPPPPAVICPPEPVNLCVQPANVKYGYGLNKPVGGVPLPIVGCNDRAEEFQQKPYKYYGEPDSRQYHGFSWREWPNVCVSACKEQYDACLATYSKGCQTVGSKNYNKRSEDSGDEAVKKFFWGGGGGGWGGSWGGGWGGWGGGWGGGAWGGGAWGGGSAGSQTCAVAGYGFAGTWLGTGSDSPQCWGRGGNKPDWARARCEAQYRDCVAVNQWKNFGGMCSRYDGC